MRIRFKPSEEPPRRREPHEQLKRKPAAFQYSSKRSQTERSMDRGSMEADTETKQNKLMKQLARLPYIFGGMAILLIVVYLLSLSPDPQIITNDKQELLRNKMEYQRAAAQLLGGKLQNKSKFTLDEETFSEEMKDKFPELSEVSLSTPILHRKPQLKLTSSRPAIIFTSGSDKYMLDKRGLALFDINKSSQKFDTAKLPILLDQTNYELTINKPALTTSQVRFIDELKTQSTSAGLNIDSMNLLAGGGELNVKFKDLSYVVKFNFFEDARKSIGTFLATKEQLEQGKTPAKEYIDVRIPLRAYVR